MCNDDFEHVFHHTDDFRDDEKIVIVTQRGNCSSAEKAMLASKVGADGILFINNEDGNIHPSGPAAHELSIYASMISAKDGLLLSDAFKASRKLKSFYAPIQCTSGAS